MFKRILVPLDGSPLAETALAPAAFLAQRFHAELLLVRTILTHVFPGADPGPAQLQALHEAESYLEPIAGRLRNEGINVRIAIPYDAPAIGIADQAEFRKVDLIVMRTHGRTGWDALLHPSVTMGVLEHTTAPILAWKRSNDQAEMVSVPALPRFMTDSEAPIVVPLDGSELAERALPVAQELARIFGNPLLLVQAAERPYVATGAIDYPAIIANAEQWATDEARSYLHRKQLEVSSSGVRVEVESALSTAPWFIDDCVQKHQAGLVVMASHGRGGFSRFLLGSVAKSVLARCEAPVLLVRLHQPQEG